MSYENELRRMSGKQKARIDIRKGHKPELQFHMAASLVMAGDPHGITAEKRADKIDEVLQVAGRFPESWTGNVRVSQIDRVIADLKTQLINALRERGALRAGE